MLQASTAFLGAMKYVLNISWVFSYSIHYTILPAIPWTCRSHLFIPVCGGMRPSVRYAARAASALLLILLYHNLIQIPLTWKTIPCSHLATSEATTTIEDPEVQDDLGGEVSFYYGIHLAELSSTSTIKAPLPTQTAGSKIIFMAKLDEENTSWVGKELLKQVGTFPQWSFSTLTSGANSWQNTIYTINNCNATLHTNINKGCEAMVYLTYIVENYGDLPDTIVFLHSIRKGWPEAWHNDAVDYDNVS